MTIELGTALALGGILMTGGAAWGGARMALNGTRKRVGALERRLEALQRDVIDRLARIETRLEGR